jgi:hypothetical protein
MSRVVLEFPPLKNRTQCGILILAAPRIRTLEDGISPGPKSVLKEVKSTQQPVMIFVQVVFARFLKASWLLFEN